MLTPEIKRARNAILIGYISNGIALGSFIARIPDFKRILGVTDGGLGSALIFGSIGVVLSLGPAGRYSAKYGSKPLIVGSAIGVGITIPGLGLLFNIYTLAIALFIWGITLGVQDISLSAHGVALEQQSGKKMLSTMHAMYSLGSIIGVSTGGVIAQLDITPLMHLSIIGVLLVLSAFLINPLLLPASMDQHNPDGHKRNRKRPKIFWILGLLGICAAIAEGVASDWGGVLARDTFGASPFVSAMPYALFSALMVIGRLSGDKLSRRFGTSRLLTAGGLIAGIGLSAGMLMNNIQGVFLGWFFLGVGVSAVIPLLMSAAGEIASKDYPDTIAPSEAVAMIAGISYFAFIAAPPLIGFLSDQITLRLALFVPAGLALMMAYGARYARSSDH